MELVNQTAEWSCYKPDQEYSKGHLVFYFAKPNDIQCRKSTGSMVTRYGKGMVDMGFAKDYYIYTVVGAVHISFRYDDGNTVSMYGFMNFIKTKCQN